jgi:hypothetical protein
MDWKKYVREHLPPLKLGTERELEMADEMAQHLEAVYDDALLTALPSGSLPARSGSYKGLASVGVRVDPFGALHSQGSPGALQRKPGLNRALEEEVSAWDH